MAAPAKFCAYVLKEARQNFALGDYEVAFDHYLLAIKVNHGLVHNIYDEFVLCLRQWTELLHCMGRDDIATTAFIKAAAVCSFSEGLMCALGEQALRLKNVPTAVRLTKEAEQSFPESICVQETWERVSYAAVERWHYKMLNDVQRNKSYHDAIIHTIQRHHITSVLDIGCGTGLLSLFAEKGGAKQVAMCDASTVMIDVCSAVMDANRQQSLSELQRCIFAEQSASLRIPDHLPEKVDLVVTEIFDAALFGEHCLSTLTHAWSHLLKDSGEKRGRVIPGAAQLYVCAVQCPEIRKENCVQPSNVPLVDMRDVSVLCQTGEAEEEPYTTEDLYCIRNSYTFLSPVHSLVAVDFNHPQALEKLSSYTNTFVLDIYAAGAVDALAVWFDLDLCEGVKVSTAPSETCCWEQAIFPVVTRQLDKREAVFQASPTVNSGDQLKVRCEVNEGRLHLELDEIVPLGYFLKSCHISTPLLETADSSHSGASSPNEQHPKHCSGELEDPQHSSAVRKEDCVALTEKSPVKSGHSDSGALCSEQNINCLSALRMKTVENGAELGDSGDTFQQNGVLVTESGVGDLPMSFTEAQHTESCMGDLPMSFTEAQHTESCMGDLPMSFTEAQHTESCMGDLPMSFTEAQHTESCMGDQPKCFTEAQHTSKELKASCMEIDHTTCLRDDEDRNCSATRDVQNSAAHAPRSDDLQNKSNLCIKITPHPQTFRLHREEIRRLNDHKYNSLCISAMQCASMYMKSPGRMIHVSNGFPLVGLLALQLDFTIADVCYVGPSEKREVENLTEAVWRCNRVGGRQWNWWEGSVGEVVASVSEGLQLHLVWMDVVDMTGTLRAGLLDELKALRPVSSTKAVVVPQAVDVYAVLIESPQLLAMSCVTSDDNTLGFNIAPHINPYRTRTFLDLDVHALPHKNLSEVTHVFRLNVQSCMTNTPFSTESSGVTTATAASTTDCDDRLNSMFSQFKQLRLTAQDSGSASAMVFWFDLTLAPGVNASTLDPAMNWKQAAFVLGGGRVEKGEEVTVGARLEKSYLHFSLDGSVDTTTVEPPF